MDTLLWTITAIVVGWFLISSLRAAYYYGVDDGYGFSREPNNPGYQKAGAYLKQQWRFGSPTLHGQAKANPKHVIELTPVEIQSRLDRVRFAELLIKQLPADHEGRNTWLLNYGSKE